MRTGRRKPLTPQTSPSRSKMNTLKSPINEADAELVLHIDSGLMAWLRAFVAGPGFFGSVEDTAVYLLRTAMLDMLKEDVWFAGTVPHLPSPIREANMRSPKYQALVVGKGSHRTIKP